MSSAITVYTAGVYDMFHVGHLNLLLAARGLGDRLIVGVSTDEVVESYKPGKLVIPYEYRHRIVSALRCVDVCIPQTDRDKLQTWQKLKFDVLAIGDDWFGRDDYQQYEQALKDVGVKVVYIPYTAAVSSTQLRTKVR